MLYTRVCESAERLYVYFTDPAAPFQTLNNIALFIWRFSGVEYSYSLIETYFN